MMEDTRLNEAQHADIERITKKIDAAVNGEDKSLTVSALTFYLLGIIQTERKFSQAEAIRYAIYHLKNFAQMIEYT